MLENVPLPSGFQLVDDRSVGTSSGQFRVAKYEFVGKSRRARLERFYREYMPSGGWTLISEDLYRGIYEMRFESDTESCIVCLRPEGRNTVINIDVRPLPKGSAEREVQLPVRKP